MFVEAGLKPFDQFQSNFSKRVDNVTWRNSLDKFL